MTISIGGQSPTASDERAIVEYAKETDYSVPPDGEGSRLQQIGKLWAGRRRAEESADFEHVHLPDDGQEFLKPTVGMLSSELQDVAAGKRERALACFREGDRAWA